MHAFYAVRTLNNTPRNCKYKDIDNENNLYLSYVKQVKLSSMLNFLRPLLAIYVWKNEFSRFK